MNHTHSKQMSPVSCETPRSKRTEARQCNLFLMGASWTKTRAIQWGLPRVLRAAAKTWEAQKARIVFPAPLKISRKTWTLGSSDRAGLKCCLQRRREMRKRCSREENKKNLNTSELIRRDWISWRKTDRLRRRRHTSDNLKHSISKISLISRKIKTNLT